MKIFFLDEFGKAIIPEKVRPGLRKYLTKAGIFDVPYRSFGILFYMCVLLSIFLFFGYAYTPLEASFSGLRLFLFSFFAGLLIASLVALVSFGIIYFYLDLKIFNRTVQMEEVLEDFLKFVSENLKGGMAFEKALWSAIKPEFGVLGTEISLTAKKVMTGEDVEDAVQEFTAKYDSPILKRSFNLIIEGLKGGGQVGELIDRVIENIGETRALKKEMATTNMTYVIFIMVVVLLITPGLFALSYQLLIILGSFISKIGATQTSNSAVNLAFSVSRISISPSDFIAFSRYALILISVFSSMIVSMIRKGSIKAGVVYIPVFVTISLIVHSILVFLLSNVFGGLVIS
jgi:pilus assembly protein TadC